MDRRDFLGIVGGLVLSGLSGDILASDDFWKHPRRLRLFSPRTREIVDEVYWRDGNLVWEGYAKVCLLMRDSRQNQAVQMDMKLLDLLTAVQAWLLYNGYRDYLHIHSGYRTERTNSSLEGAAKNSLHLKGMAADFSVPGLPSNTMGLLASHFKGGGVGFYPDRNFTHVDTGSVRYWTGARKRFSEPKALR